MIVVGDLSSEHKLYIWSLKRCQYFIFQPLFDYVEAILIFKNHLLSIAT